jgi:hypothetical protein
MFVEGLYSLLANNVTLKTALGVPRTDNYSGIFSQIAPEEVLLPYIVYFQVHREPVLSFQGVNKFQTIRLQLSCYGASYKDARLLANIVKNILDGFTGELSEGTIVGNTIPVSEHDEAEPVYKATVYGTHLDYSFTIIAKDGE